MCKNCTFRKMRYKGTHFFLITQIFPTLFYPSGKHSLPLPHRASCISHVESHRHASLMMIWLTPDYGAGAIYLLRKDEPHHLMRESHLRHTYLLIGTGIHAIRESIRSSDDKDETADRSILLPYPPCKLYGTKLLAVLIEQHDMVGGLQAGKDKFALSLLLLRLTERFRILQFWNDRDGKRHIMTYALAIVLYSCLKMLVDSLPYQYQFCLHYSDANFDWNDVENRQ